MSIQDYLDKGGKLTIQQYLDQQCAELNLKWLTVVSGEGLTMCGSGIDEQFELAALLPDWMDTGHKLAHSAQMEHGMGLACLVPRSGDFLLLVRDFTINDERMFLLIATPKIPPKAAKVMAEIGQYLQDNF